VQRDEARELIDTIAIPWRAWLPAAVPDDALIDASRFFRMGDIASAHTAEALTGWWRFVLAALVVYGLLPRVLMLIVALARQRAATRALLLDDSRVTALLDRMATPLVVLEGEGADQTTIDMNPRRVAPHRGIAGRARAVVWADAVDESTAAPCVERALGIAVTGVVDAGGNRSLTEDRASIAAVRDAETIVVLVRAFEPPLNDLLDYLQALRREAGTGTSIVVLPVPATGETVTDVERETWTGTIARLDDPATYVEVCS
jgi:hypothetical protein